MLLHLLQLILLTSVSVLALPTAREATDNHVQIVAYSYDSVPDAIPYDQITIINYGTYGPAIFIPLRHVLSQLH